MHYALSSSLGSMSGLNTDKLALDLQFATDKTLTARRGPTPTFTRASTATFVGSNGLIQSAAINAARFDHDPVTLACKGLLIEESRTNLTTQSGNASVWASANGTVTNNGSTTAPDGSSNGFLGGIGTASLITPSTPSVTGLHTASVFLKRNNTDWARIQVAQGSFTHAVNFWVNLATGAAGTLSVATGTPTSLSAQVTPFGNSWYRISITASYPATASLTLTVISASADNNATRVAGSVYELWGGQIEAGSFPTSYIPTTTASVVRSADVCSITGSDFTGMYNAAEGTIIAAASIDTLAGNNRGIYGINNNTSAHGFLTFYNATSNGILSQSRNTTSTNLNPTFTNSAGVKFTRGLSYYLGGCSISTNGASATDTATTISTQTMLTMQIGNMLGGSFQGTCHISTLRYYKKRVSNSRLQKLTT